MIGRMPGGGFTLRTDISQYYASIYTHAVDWVIRGKSRAKKLIRGAGLGPALDQRLREARSGQTVGISIGPDTSWVIGELMLGRIDEELLQSHPAALDRAVRFGDDMLFYASSEGEAYDLLGNYQKILATYELILNPIKVRVSRGLDAPSASWVTRLRQARYRDASDSQLTSDLVDIFNLALESAQEFPTDGVLKYAMQRCNPFPSGKQSWSVYQNLLLAVAKQEPSTLPIIYDMLAFAKAQNLPVTAALEDVLSEMCMEHARLDHGFEVSWILTILRELKITVDSDLAEAITSMDCNLSLLLIMDERSRSARLRRDVDVSLALKRAEASEALWGPDWLLAYESRVSRWCAPKKWGGAACWRELAQRKVRFLVPRPARRLVLRKRRLPAFMRLASGV